MSNAGAVAELATAYLSGHGETHHTLLYHKPASLSVVHKVVEYFIDQTQKAHSQIFTCHVHHYWCVKYFSARDG